MSHVHQSKELAETHLYIMIPHSGKWEEIGERADNEANGRANTKGSAKDPFSRCCDVRVHFGISAVLSNIDNYI